MQEYLGEAIILDSRANGDADVRFYVFTKKYGKLAAKGKSVRKITSKLSGHLQPGNLVYARIVEKNGPQIVDALKKGKVAAGVADLYFLNRLLHEGEADQLLWRALTAEKFDWRAVLGVLGWDENGACCAACPNGKPQIFDAERQEFFCRNCSTKLPQKDLLYIGNG